MSMPSIGTDAMSADEKLVILNGGPAGACYMPGVEVLANGEARIFAICHEGIALAVPAAAALQLAFDLAMAVVRETG